MTTAKKTTAEGEEKKVVAKAAPVKRAAAPRKKKEDEDAAADTAEVVVAEGTKDVAAGTYIYALGRRKRSIAQVRIFPTGGKGKMTVNGKAGKVYFPVYAHQMAIVSPLKTIGREDIDVEAKVLGGGLRGQADAVRLGVSRALLLLNENFRKPLKAEGFLTRDPREKERKKFGLKKARKAAQWAKR